MPNPIGNTADVVFFAVALVVAIAMALMPRQTIAVMLLYRKPVAPVTIRVLRGLAGLVAICIVILLGWRALGK